MFDFVDKSVLTSQKHFKSYESPIIKSTKIPYTRNRMNATQGDDSIVHQYSAFFLLDFGARYAVDRCGADDTLFVAFLSWVCILPYWIWTATFLLMLTRVELYWAMAKWTITLLTICTFILLYLFDRTPPVLGCGPDQSFPSPQAALSAYGATTFFYYIDLKWFCQSSPSKSRHTYNQWLHGLVVGNLVIVTLGLSWIGMADPTSIIAGALLGALIAALLHEVLLNLSEDKGSLTKFVLFLEKKLGIHTVDTLLSVIPGYVHEEDIADITYGADPNQKSDESSMSYTTTVNPINYKPMERIANPDQEVVALNSQTPGH